MIADEFDHLDPEQLRQALRTARAEVAQRDELLQRREREAAFKQAVIDKLTHENAILKRLKSAAQSEAFNAEQKSLLEETLDADLAAVAAEIEALEPGSFTVERHIRGKWVCKCCEKITQGPVAPHVIDKGLPTAGLLAQVLVAKYLDHLPLYRQEAIFQRAGHLIARSTLAQWVGECGVQLQPLVDALAAELLRQPVLHADETPVAMLKPGHGKTHRAYL